MAKDVREFGVVAKKKIGELGTTDCWDADIVLMPAVAGEGSWDEPHGDVVQPRVPESKLFHLASYLRVGSVKLSEVDEVSADTLRGFVGVRHE